MSTFILLLFALLTPHGPDSGPLPARPGSVSTETQTCIDCHEQYTPGIVEDWKSSRHSRMTPAEGLTRPNLERRVSATRVPAELEGTVVGCFECHSRNAASHADNFEHFGFQINVIVTPADCGTCHPVEAEQYGRGKKAHALDNLEKNPVYSLLVDAIVSMKSAVRGTLQPGKASGNARNETCYACHGTRVGVRGTRTVNTEAGEITVPVLTNWPNTGVGRINPDGSAGSCTSCHARHGFSLELARKPSTCGQCHLEPDVPAYNVYKESKHGNIEESLGHRWTWDAVPWKVGGDFTAPTCAACHNSLLVNAAGGVIAERSHTFDTRLWVRLFGLITSHPQPKSGATHTIKNADGLPLPTTFAGVPAAPFLISPEEQQARRSTMRRVCTACHGPGWVDGHFAKLDTTLTEADGMVLAATGLLAAAWDRKMADRKNPFDEALEQQWVRQWLFYANSVRYGSAMSGPDYAAFKNGWWELTNGLQRMHETVNPARKK